MAIDNPQKRSASSPPAVQQDREKLQRNKSPHRTHVSCLQTSVLKTPTPVSTHRTGDAGNSETDMDINQLYVLFQEHKDLVTKQGTDIEDLQSLVTNQSTRITNLEKLVADKDTHIANLESANAKVNAANAVLLRQFSSSPPSPSATGQSPNNPVQLDSGVGDTSDISQFDMEDDTYIPPSGIPRSNVGGSSDSQPSDSGIPRSNEGDSSDSQPSDSTDNSGFAPLHSTCTAKAKKLFYGLNNTKTFPRHATTLAIGDSLLASINSRDINSRDSLRIRTVGGLCIAAYVTTLQHRERPLGNIKRLILSLGVNDHLHRRNHCFDDIANYFLAMGVETKRIFPNASVFFVMPYKGITKMSSLARKDLMGLVKLHCPSFKIFSPPTLQDKVNEGGVHPTDEGAKVLTEFYRKLIPTPPRTFSRDSGRRSHSPTFANAVTPGAPQAVSTARQQPVRPTDPSPVSTDSGQRRLRRNSAPGPPGSGNPSYLAWEIATAVTKALQTSGLF